MMPPKNVTVIPATINPKTRLPNMAVRLRRVAGYARVSTDSEEQLTSYEVQVDYYTRYIHSRSDWQFVAVYLEAFKEHSTYSSTQFLKHVAEKFPYAIECVQTDNGFEFTNEMGNSKKKPLTLFEKTLAQMGIRHKKIKPFITPTPISRSTTSASLLSTIVWTARTARTNWRPSVTL